MKKKMISNCLSIVVSLFKTHYALFFGGVKGGTRARESEGESKAKLVRERERGRASLREVA